MTLDKIIEERSSDYGRYPVHAKTVGSMMESLRDVYIDKNNISSLGTSTFTHVEETTLFYICTKLARIAASPSHKDSIVDMVNYLRLYHEYKFGEKI